MSQTTDRPRVAHEALLAFIEAAFANQGLPRADAAQVAALMAEADLQGSDGHGVIRLAPYLKRLRAGGIISPAFALALTLP